MSGTLARIPELAGFQDQEVPQGLLTLMDLMSKLKGSQRMHAYAILVWILHAAIVGQCWCVPTVAFLWTQKRPGNTL